MLPVKRANVREISNACLPLINFHPSTEDQKETNADD